MNTTTAEVTRHPDYRPLPPLPPGAAWGELAEELDAYRRRTGACLTWTLAAARAGDLVETRRRFAMVLTVPMNDVPTNEELERAQFEESLTELPTLDDVLYVLAELGAPIELGAVRIRTWLAEQGWYCTFLKAEKAGRIRRGLSP